MLAARLSIAQTHRDGLIEDLRTRKDVQGLNNVTVRGQLLFEPDHNIEVRVIGDYARQRQRCCINIVDGVFTTLANGAPVPKGFYARAARLGYTLLPVDPFARRTDADSPFKANMNQSGISTEIDWKLKNALLTSGYRLPQLELAPAQRQRRYRIADQRRCPAGRARSCARRARPMPSLVWRMPRYPTMR